MTKASMVKLLMVHCNNAPHNVEAKIKLDLRAIAVSGNRRSRNKQSVIKYIINLVVLFSGFKNRSHGTSEQNHPRNLNMVALSYDECVSLDVSEEAD